MDWTGVAGCAANLPEPEASLFFQSKKAYRELRELTAKVRTGQSEAADLEGWETSLAEMEKHPNEFNKLENEIGLRRAFVQYLERHYPQDARLPDMQEAAAYQKDSVWGIKIGDYGPRK